MGVEQISRDRYDRVAILLHWATAAFVLFNLGVGFFMEGLPGPLRGIVIPLHISAGFTVLALTGVRVFWRLFHLPPALIPGLSAWERHLATIAHFLIYCALVLMPLSGWALLSSNPPPRSAGTVAASTGQVGSSAGPNRTQPAPRIWWIVPRPVLRPLQAIGETPGGVRPQKQLHDSFVDLHRTGALVLIALLLMHVAGALKHQFHDRQRQLERMGIARRRRGGRAAAPTTGSPD